MDKPLVVNFIGGPGSGKSTLASAVFSKLKMKTYNVEIVTEFAKDLCWSERQAELGNQVYVLGKQYHRLWRLKGKVLAIITDSPLMLSKVYNNNLAHLNPLVDELINQFTNINYLVKRHDRNYVREGRNQSYNEAITLDSKIAGVCGHDFIEVKASDETAIEISNRIELLINLQRIQ